MRKAWQATLAEFGANIPRSGVLCPKGYYGGFLRIHGGVGDRLMDFLRLMAEEGSPGGFLRPHGGNEFSDML